MPYNVSRKRHENQDMRIAMIGCKGIPATMAHGGGIERHVEQLAPRLVKEGHDVTVYVRPYTNPRKRKSWQGVNLITKKTIQTKHLEAIVHTFLATWHAIFQQYDIIHYHGVGPSTLAWMPRLFCPKTKVVVTFHSRDQFHEKWNVFARIYLAWGEWTAMRFPHATIAVSHVIQHFCKKVYGNKPFFIPNGVEIPEKSVETDEIEKMGLRPNGYILGLGRLIPHKAFDVAIDAFKDVPTAMDLAIAGDAGYDLHYAERLYELADKDSRAKLLGFQTGDALKQLLAHCYAFIHPSRSEGLSVAVLEAMANGKMVIMSDIPENLELIDHSGIRFKMDDLEDLKKTLSWAVEDAEMVYERGLRGREHVRMYYNWEAITKKTILVYHTLLTSKK